MVRAPFYDKNGVKKGAWSQEEDDKLKAYIQRYGHWNWRELPKFAGLSRCGKSCRLRWINYLRPDVRIGNYTEEEERLIMKLHEELGNKWSIIASKLPGRTDNEVKNYWHTHLKKHSKKRQKFDHHRGSSIVEQQRLDDHTFQRADVVQISTNNTINTFVHPILESCPLSPQTYNSTDPMMSWSNSGHDREQSPMSSSCNDLSKNIEENIDNNDTDNNNNHSTVGTFDYFQPWVEFEESSSGDFWTEPFVVDNIYNQEMMISNPYNTSVSFAKDGILLPCDLYHDDGTELIYQVMQELSNC